MSNSASAHNRESLSSQKPFVCLEKIWKTRGQNVVLKGVDLEITNGEIICLLGPSGAGKSTLLRCINAIEPADRGLIYVDDVPIGCKPHKGGFVRMKEHEVARQRADIGMVFQNFNLFPHMSVLENIIDAPMRIRGEPRAVAETRAIALLEQVGLAEKATAFPRHLSGGQQQRVAIARALAMKPKLMLFDEPTSALDPHLTHEVLDVMKDLASTGMTMIIVTHEIQFARDIADSIAIMADGAIIEHGPASSVLSSPKHPTTQSFLARSLPN
ncbi:amino acid ABC transporter ATP-binding protein [Rhizobium lusitanum]|uniref:amino acid ABC transporter ATP-binding protein n=1 Tax=Rhizobium lusitanum TaxID=293958 RepID=UPI001574AED3|nr:amino acid ABC transporter ATP-binding protein [Rhizobium lusitanum]NTJ11582.1 amino acid ABC transporter ATP-binding protein [Rhizobium lusitanum]